MKTTAVLKCVMETLRDEFVVAANGRISRDAFTLKDRSQNFYMIGSMGLASSIALGLAVTQPQCKVVILDGDGNVLMNLGGLPQIGELLPPNIIHIVLDNETYGSTGNQATISRKIYLEKIAQASGYLLSEKVTEEGAFKHALEKFLDAQGPSFLLVKVEAEEEPKGLPRVSHSPIFIRDRFMEAIKNIGICRMNISFGS
ncbi:MAG TPA: thiamine pyrophosphate-dependent enzyme [Candidatus Hypogeohydataceae bacterium YC41]